MEFMKLLLRPHDSTPSMTDKGLVSRPWVEFRMSKTLQAGSTFSHLHIISEPGKLIVATGNHLINIAVFENA